TQSGLVSDVSFFRRPSLLAIIAFACGDACAEVDADIRTAISGASAQLSFRLGGSDDALTYQPTGLAEAAARAGLSKSLLAGSSDLADSSHPGLFAGAEAADSLPAALSDDSSLPAETRRQLRFARALADRAVASGLLADSQPDALRVDIPTVGLTADARRRVVEFAVKLAGPAGRRRRAPAGLCCHGNRSDFPVMFNLILWLSVVLALAVYAVAYGLWNIDPGKDSIIYRRGYAHAKKD
uniref:Renin receptor n=1 Tax=Macrostomum lignano TaxID=282301 RepID=A0A1I8J215_9PLAT